MTLAIGHYALMIDRSGEWWIGDSASDLHEFMHEYTSHNYAASVVQRPECGDCGRTVFRLLIDDEAGCAERSCTNCSSRAFVADSVEQWADAEPGQATCPCDRDAFEVAVGFSLTDAGEVRWVTVGGRCIECGRLCVYTDWKIDYEPSRHLLTAY